MLTINNCKHKAPLDPIFKEPSMLKFLDIRFLELS